MGRPYEGEFMWDRKKINVLANELKAWMLLWDDESLTGNWNIQEFAVQKQIPYERWFLGRFQEKSVLFQSIMEWASDAMEVRFNKLVGAGKIPPTYAALVAKNKFGYRDRQDLKLTETTEKKKSRKARVQEAIAQKFRRSDSK